MAAAPSSRSCFRRYQEPRTSFDRPDLPFLFVQLPGFIEHRGGKDRRLDMDAAALAALHQPTQAGMWTDVREAQLNVWRSVPHTGMAVTIDIGEPYDIHPKLKEPVADRLLLERDKWLTASAWRAAVRRPPTLRSTRTASS